MRTKGISGNDLKWIAMITMFIDHIGAMIIEPYLVAVRYQGMAGSGIVWPEWLYQVNEILRMIGRVSFPIFCFLLVEGFCRTRDLKKYISRIALAALISEIPFDLAVRGTMTPDLQNVMFTLLIGLLTMSGMQYFRERYENKESKAVLWGVQLLPAAAGIAVAHAFRTDYGGMGVLLIVILYLCRNNRVKQCLLGALCFLWESTSVFAFVFISRYNGERKNGRLKYIFYFFYPVHIAIFYGIACAVVP